MSDSDGFKKKQEEDRIKAQKARYEQLGNCTNSMCMTTCKEFKYPLGGECFKYGCQCIYASEEHINQMQMKTTLKPGATTDRTQMKLSNDYDEDRPKSQEFLIPPGFLESLNRRKNKNPTKINLHALKRKRHRKSMRRIQDKYWDAEGGAVVLLRGKNGHNIFFKLH